MKYICTISMLLALSGSAAATEMRFYNDAYGAPVASSMRLGNTTYYNDSYGSPIGSAMELGNQTYYNDQYGRPLGSEMTLGGDD